MSNKKLIQNFLGQAKPVVIDYNTLMVALEHIESITGTKTEVGNFIVIPYWFSKRKVLRFSPGFGGGQQPDYIRTSNFDTLGGKFHRIVIGTTLESKEKLKAATKLKAIEKGVVHFIKWYNAKVA